MLSEIIHGACAAQPGPSSVPSYSTQLTRPVPPPRHYVFALSPRTHYVFLLPHCLLPLRTQGSALAITPSPSMLTPLTLSLIKYDLNADHPQTHMSNSQLVGIRYLISQLLYLLKSVQLPPSWWGLPWAQAYLKWSYLLTDCPIPCTQLDLPFLCSIYHQSVPSFIHSDLLPTMLPDVSQVPRVVPGGGGAQ